MNRSTKSIVLAFSGLALVLAVVSAAFHVPLALGAAALAGGCAVWVAMMSTAQNGRHDRECSEEAKRAVDAPAVQTPEPQRQSLGDDGATSGPSADLTLPTSVDPSAVLRSLLDNVAAAGNAVAVSLWLEDVGTPTLRLVCAEGAAQPDPTPVPASDGILGTALASGAAQCGRVVQSGHEAASEPQWRYALPLLTEEASGIVVVDFVGESEPDTEHLERLSSAMKGLLTGSLALHVARSEASSARQLLETASDLSRLLDPQAVVSAALNHALKLSGAETGSVMLLDADGVTMRIACARGLPEDIVGTTRVSEGEGIAGWVLASSRPLVVEDLEHKGPQSRRHGVLSAASVPIMDDDGVLGVLNVGSRRFHPRLSRTHVHALEAIGRIAATSLRNARAVTITQDLFFDTLKALAFAMETRDPYTRGGTARILEITTALGESMGLDEVDAYALELAALLHDIGMSAAGEGVVSTDRPLTTVEWGMLKMHPQIAAEILSQAPALRTVVPIVFHHHEHYDGRGYASGLVGDEIPLGARILSVADAYVAMTSARPYRLAMSAEMAMAEMESASGTQFDPDVVQALVGLTSNEVGRFAQSKGRP